MIKAQIFELIRDKNISVNICENKNGKKQIIVYKKSNFSNKLNKIAVDFLEEAA